MGNTDVRVGATVPLLLIDYYECEEYKRKPDIRLGHSWAGSKDNNESIRPIRALTF